MGVVAVGRFAEHTNVPVERSRAEIETVLNRYGASAFAYGWNPRGAAIEFAADNRRVRFVLPLPDKAEFSHTTRKVNQHHAQRVRRSDADQEKAWEQACRQRWRALLLAIKAKLEAVDVGISTFENEFLAQIVLPEGRTVGEMAGPAIELAYASGTMGELLPGMPPAQTG